MSCFLFTDDEESNRKINIDELYEKQQQKDLKQLSIFNKILNRIHKRILQYSRIKPMEKFVWFTVPEYIFGEPIYDNGECTGYLVAKLHENGFDVRYIHPNTLWISWKNWVPSYVRSEIKKKTGYVLDEKGNIIDKKEKETEAEPLHSLSTAEKQPGSLKNGKSYTPIQNYKPTGNLVYNAEMFEKLEKKIN
jgi:Family of unknown function (DUF5759)